MCQPKAELLKANLRRGVVLPRPRVGSSKGSKPMVRRRQKRVLPWRLVFFFWAYIPQKANNCLTHLSHNCPTHLSHTCSTKISHKCSTHLSHKCPTHLNHKSPIHLSHKCPIPISHYVSTSHLMCEILNIDVLVVLVLPHSTHNFCCSELACRNSTLNTGNMWWRELHVAVGEFAGDISQNVIAHKTSTVIATSAVV